MTRRATPQPGVDRMVSTSWSGRRWSSPAARQGRALARGLEGRLPLQHHHVRDQNSSSSRCRAYFSLALKHGIYRDRTDGHRGRGEISSYLCSPVNARTLFAARAFSITIDALASGALFCPPPPRRRSPRHKVDRSRRGGDAANTGRIFVVNVALLTACQR